MLARAARLSACCLASAFWKVHQVTARAATASVLACGATPSPRPQPVATFTAACTLTVHGRAAGTAAGDASTASVRIR